jgi:sulfoquinovose isomerase
LSATSGANRSKCAESWDEAFSKTEDYRGGNANMHAVEAFLIVYDVTHDRKWLDRALRIASVIIHDVARKGEYRVNEHFDTTGTRSAITTSITLPTASAPTAARRPLDRVGPPDAAPARRAGSARNPAGVAAGRCERTVPRHHPRRLGTDGADGFVYSVGWDGKPMSVNACAGQSSRRWARLAPLHRDRRSAVRSLVSEVVGLLHQVPDGLRNGSWWQELDTNNEVTTKVWDGKQDIYHLLHCLVIPACRWHRA